MHIELHTRRAKTAAEIYSSVTQRILPSISPRESFRFPLFFLSEYKSQIKIREGKRGERAMSRYRVFEISASRCQNSDTNNSPCKSGRKIYPPHSNSIRFWTRWYRFVSTDITLTRDGSSRLVLAVTLLRAAYGNRRCYFYCFTFAVASRGLSNARNRGERTAESG